MIMENHIHQMMELDNGKKYGIFKQAIYKGENYYVAMELDENEQPLENFSFFHETKENGESFVELVQDEKMITLLVEYLKLAEEK